MSDAGRLAIIKAEIDRQRREAGVWFRWLKPADVDFLIEQVEKLHKIYADAPCVVMKEEREP